MHPTQGGPLVSALFSLENALCPIMPFFSTAGIYSMRGGGDIARFIKTTFKTALLTSGIGIATLLCDAQFMLLVQEAYQNPRGHQAQAVNNVVGRVLALSCETGLIASSIQTVFRNVPFLGGFF